MLRYAVICLMISGCSTLRFNSKMGKWVGQPIDTVVAKYGPPSSKYQNDTLTVYGFHFDEGTTYRQGLDLGGQMQIRATNNVCDISFNVRANVVESWSSRGRCREGSSY